MFLVFLAVYEPLDALLASIFSKEIAQTVLVNISLLIFGLLGFIMIIRKEAPYSIFLIRGLPAIIIGAFLTLVSFGGIIWGIIRNIFKLKVP